MDRVRDRVRVRGLAIAAHSYNGPNHFQWGRKLEFAQMKHRTGPHNPQNDRTGPPKLGEGSPLSFIPRVDHVSFQ